MDVLAVEEAARQAAEAVREGGGPHFLEMRTYRFRAHSMYDPDRYRDKTEIEAWKERDPIPALTAQLSDRGVLAEGDLGRLEVAISAEVDDAVAYADAGTDEPLEDLERFVTSEVSAGGSAQ
jgi:pyruvate dehydrogenase E1 component alpha subunit